MKRFGPAVGLILASLIVLTCWSAASRAPASWASDAALTLSPAAAAPGTLVTVTAPAGSASGGDGMGTFDVQLQDASGQSGQISEARLRQAADGSVSGTFRVPFSLYPFGILGPGSYSLVLEQFLPAGS